MEWIKTSERMPKKAVVIVGYWSWEKKIRMIAWDRETIKNNSKKIWLRCFFDFEDVRLFLKGSCVGRHCPEIGAGKTKRLDVGLCLWLEQID